MPCYLALHGAMVAEGMPDVEGELLAARARAGRSEDSRGGHRSICTRTSPGRWSSRPTPWCSITPRRTSTCSRPASAPRRCCARHRSKDARPPGDGVSEAAAGRARRARQHAGSRPASASRSANTCSDAKRIPTSSARAWPPCSRGSTSPSWVSDRRHRHRRRRRQGRSVCAAIWRNEALAAAARLPAGAGRSSRGGAAGRTKNRTAWSSSAMRADATNSGSTGESTAILSELVEVRLAAAGAGDDGRPGRRRRSATARRRRSLHGRARRRARSPVFHADPARRRSRRTSSTPSSRLTGHLGKNMPIDMGPAGGAAARQRASPGHVALRPALRPGLLPQRRPRSVRGQGADRQESRAASAPRIRTTPRRSTWSVRPAALLSDFWKHPYANIPRPLWPWDEIDGWTPDPILVP